MVFFNLRNRPLSSRHLDSMRQSILTLYHDFATGSKHFPVIDFIGYFSHAKLHAGFRRRTENKKSTRYILAPTGSMVPPAGSSCTAAFLTPVLPEWAELGAVKADGRNFVQTVKFKGLTFTRVISTVYSPDGSELLNRWRVTDYTLYGHVIMSALCYFTDEFGDKELTPIQRRRKPADKIIRSSQSKNCLRLWCFCMCASDNCYKELWN